MINFNYISIFPNLIEPYFKDSILKRAISSGIISYNFINPRDFTTNKHNKVDDYLCGGGAGLLMAPQPLFDALDSIKEETHIIFLLASAKPFKQIDAKRLAKKKSITFVCGRYEGIDERVIEKYADEVFSIGDYILTGGELASLVMSDSIARNIQGVLGNSSSLEGESYQNSLLEAPNFTKPANFKENYVIKEFLKGNHSKIDNLKHKLSLCKTKYFRPRFVANNKRIENEK
jgi:tRNA (guanine37-N1)-methyltransferase